MPGELQFCQKTAVCTDGSVADAKEEIFRCTKDTEL